MFLLGFNSSKTPTDGASKTKPKARSTIVERAVFIRSLFILQTVPGKLFLAMSFVISGPAHRKERRAATKQLLCILPEFSESFLLRLD